MTDKPRGRARLTNDPMRVRAKGNTAAGKRLRDLRISRRFHEAARRYLMGRARKRRLSLTTLRSSRLRRRSSWLWPPVCRQHRAAGWLRLVDTRKVSASFRT